VALLKKLPRKAYSKTINEYIFIPILKIVSEQREIVINNVEIIEDDDDSVDSIEYTNNKYAYSSQTHDYDE
jgi:hypothetical protein